MAFMPVFAVILFGLSMDYHVFILSRIREAYDRGMKTEDAVRFGIKTTAGVVTSAAIVMVFVFGIFATLSIVMLKQFGVGLATAVLIDATIVQAVGLPAAMMLLGDWNWYLPRWLEWLPRLEHERSAEPVGEPEPARLAPELESGSVGPGAAARAYGPAPARGPEWGPGVAGPPRSGGAKLRFGPSQCSAAPPGSPRSQSRYACSAIASRVGSGTSFGRRVRGVACFALALVTAAFWLGVFLCLPADSGWSVASSFLRPRPGRACSSAMEASLSRRGLRGRRRPPSRPSGKLKVRTDATSGMHARRSSSAGQSTCLVSRATGSNPFSGS